MQNILLLSYKPLYFVSVHVFRLAGSNDRNRLLGSKMGKIIMCFSQGHSWRTTASGVEPGFITFRLPARVQSRGNKVGSFEW